MECVIQASVNDKTVFLSLEISLEVFFKLVHKIFYKQWKYMKDV